MSRCHALGGVSAIAIQNALSGEAKVLPPVTVDAPRMQARRASVKPVVRVAARRPAQGATASERKRPVVVVDTAGAGANASLGTPPAVARFQLPQQSCSITAKQIDETINLKDPEDAVKYMPSVFVRKRNDGDNQAVLATRSWGLNSSARTLIYYDDLLISALIGNNNSGASPKWNLISPQAIGRVDFLNGPFAAAYPGNSIGGVVLITSKMPDKPVQPEHHRLRSRYRRQSIPGARARPHLTGELNIEHKWSDGRVRLTLFKEKTYDAITSQTNNVADAKGNQIPTTTIGNVDAIRMQGVELSAEKDSVGIKGLLLFASVTCVDSNILIDPTWAGVDPLTNKATVAIGKRVPFVPDWRSKFGVTYRPNESWAYTVAARYSGKQYSTLDNTDRIPHLFGAFDNFFVVDMKVHYNATRNFAFDFGIDNLFNQQYFLFHPFPGRTFVLAGKYTF